MGLVVGRVVKLEAVGKELAAQVSTRGQVVDEALKKGLVDIEVTQIIAQPFQRGRLRGAEEQPLKTAGRVGHDTQRVGGGLGEQGLVGRPVQANVARELVHKPGERGLHGRGLKVEIGAAKLGCFGLPLAQQLTDY